MATPTRKKNEERTEPPQSLVKVGADAPSWLAEIPAEQDTSFEGLEQYRVLPRIKLVQGTSGQELQEKFKVGTAIIIPSMQTLAAPGEHFRIVPIFGFTEFRVWSDLKDKNSPTIEDRTFDQGSQIAMLARDPNRRSEPYGEINPKTGRPAFTRRYVEHLCFGCMVYDREHPLFTTPIVLEFARGEFSKGTQFISSTMLRRAGGRPVPLFGQVWEFTPAFRDRGDRKWWGLDFQNPTDGGAYVQNDEIEFFWDLHRGLKSDFEKKRLAVNTADAETEAAEFDEHAADSSAEM